MNKELNNSTLLSSNVITKENGMTLSIGLRKVSNMELYSSIGLVAVDMIVSTVIVDSELGNLEIVVGTSKIDACKVINTISKEKIHFEDVSTVAELMCNWDNINQKVEYKVIKGHYLSIKEIISEPIKVQDLAEII